VTDGKAALEADSDDLVADLHLWRVGPKNLAAIVSLVTDDPRAPEHYKAILAERLGIAHVTVEVNRCPGDPSAAGGA
jgi:Co/Zn/Cd efflux system component